MRPAPPAAANANITATEGAVNATKAAIAPEIPATRNPKAKPN